MKKLFTISLILGSVHILINAQVIHVPTDQPTIQAGIDVAEDEDTILVSEGTYFENINFLGKPITVASMFILDGDTSHVSRTIIDGSQSTNPDTASTVIMISGEDTTSVLTGFTIQGGKGTIFIPSFDGFRRRAGGGIFMFNSGGLIYRNIIMQNHLEDPDNRALFGGGISVWQELNHTSIIRENQIHHNTVVASVNASGGGVSLIGGRGICEGNAISDNHLSSLDWADGGGIFWYRFDSKETIDKGIIRNNSIINNSVSGKSGGGGGYYQQGGTDGSQALVYNNIFSHNITQGNYGSAILANTTVGAIFNNTIADNLQDANKHSVGLLPGEAGLAFFNNIVSTSTNVSYPDIGLYGGGKAYMYHNLHNKPLPSNLTMTVAEGNIYLGPEFEPGSFELAQNSPAVGRGIDSLFILDTYYLAPGTDLNGNPRPNPIDGRVDMGAIESPFEAQVYIPDTAFLNALIEEGVDTNDDSLISYKEAQVLTTLDINGGADNDIPGNIFNMTGIEAFVNLNTLHCSWNQITSLDVSNNTALTELHCQLNQLTSLDLSNNKSLRILICNDNQLSQLDLSENTELAILICKSNNLEYLSLTNNTDLQVLRANGNSLTNLNLSTNKRLVGEMDDDVFHYFINGLWGADCSTLNLGDMPDLTEVCVWEGFSLDSMEDEAIVLEGSPNVCFETNCNGVCDEITGKEESLQSGINIYPNPSNNHLNIETGILDLYNIEITSLNGQLILSKEMEGTTHQLDLSSFQKGIYFITIRSKDLVTTRKIIKL